MATKYLLLLMVFLCIYIVVLMYMQAHSRQKKAQELGLSERREWVEDTVLVKVLHPAMTFFMPIISLIKVPESVRRMYRQKIIGAGLESKVTVNDLVGLHFVLPILGVLIGMGMGVGPVYRVVIIVLTFVMPYIWISDLEKKRCDEIVRQLPDAVDIIALSVQGGLDFEKSLMRVIDSASRNQNTSPLIYEFRVYLQNIRLGRSSEDSLTELAQRVQRREMSSFTSVLIQARKYGTSIVDTLIEQAKVLRSERFMTAEKKGAVAAQKIMLPMMLFIFPLVFAVILLPYVLKYFAS